MNIVNKLTIRHLKQNKRRTLITIVGVIISVAMITAVATLGVSFLNLMIKQSIADGGEWHVLYKDVNKSQLAAITSDEATKTMVMTKELGYAPLEGGYNVSKPYLFVKAYSTQGFAQFPIKLIEGRLPQSAQEVVISEAIADNAQLYFKVGDTLSLEVGKRMVKNEDGTLEELDQTSSLRWDYDKVIEYLEDSQKQQYTIVGIIKRPDWEPAWAPGYTILTYMDEEGLAATDTVDAAVVLNKISSSLYTHAETLAKTNQIDKYYFNNELLRYYGLTNNDHLRSFLYSLSAIVMVVIIVGSVSLIYNAFAISVSERSRHLGMLSSVGATKRQKRNSVFFEGAIIGLISIPIGILCGLAGIGITFWLMNSIIEGALGMSERLTLIVTPSSVLLACAVSILTIFISTYVPAIRASRVSAIDAIRQTTDIKLTGKTVKTSKLIRNIFGIEAEIGLKNLKRNKRRYQATVFSLVISIILFLVVSSFTANLTKSLTLSQDGVNYDIEVYMNNGKAFTEEQGRLIKSIVALPDITESNLVHQVDINTMIDEAAIADELKESLNSDSSRLENGKYPYYVVLTGVDDQYLQTFAAANGADYNKLIDPKHLSGIVIDTISYEDRIAEKYVETKAIHAKAGQRLDLTYSDSLTGTEHALGTVEIAALTDQFPMGVRPAGVGGVNMIVSERIMDQIIGDTIDSDYQQTYLYLKSADPMKTQQQIEDMKERALSMYNVYQARQQEEQMIMLMSVFTYGFIALITAISVANIFNTISTSISLRKREFAMLRSVGMTPKGFNKMINYESIFYGIKSLLYGLPISIVAMYLIHRSAMNSFTYGFTLPWDSFLYAIVAVFLIVSSAMLYSSSKVKKENIIDALKQESI